MEIKWQTDRDFVTSCIESCVYKKHTQAVRGYISVILNQHYLVFG